MSENIWITFIVMFLFGIIMNFKLKKGALRGIDKPIKNKSHLDEFFDTFEKAACLEEEKYRYDFKVKDSNTTIRIEKLLENEFSVQYLIDGNLISESVVSLSECKFLVWDYRESINNVVYLATWESYKKENPN